MKRFVLSASAILSLAVIAASCKKSDDHQTCVAGPSGITQVVVYAVHNGDTIIHSTQQPDTAFVNWSNTSSAAAYDKIYSAEAGENHIHLSSLNCGTYNVRLSVFDSVNNARYTGSTSLSFEKTSGEVRTAINVN
jgi:hypothetical protein